MVFGRKLEVTIFSLLETLESLLRAEEAIPGFPGPQNTTERLKVVTSHIWLKIWKNMVLGLPDALVGLGEALRTLSGHVQSTAPVTFRRVRGGNPGKCAHHYS